jgi:hypothetical protein
MRLDLRVARLTGCNSLELPEAPAMCMVGFVLAPETLSEEQMEIFKKFSLFLKNVF